MTPNQRSHPVCPDCGNPLPPDSPQALCPACLMRQALASRTIGDGGCPVTPPLTPDEIADKFPGFEILECLGRGGMGVVYKARQKSLNRLVAIKILPPERVGEPRFAERFAREAELLAQLSHPHIVTVHDFGETGGHFFIVMEFVDGVNLRDLLREGKLEPKQALAIIPPVCEALQFAHDKGIVHRDIKPENLLLDKEGRVKIADFGIAKLMDAAEPDGKDPQHPVPADTLKAGTRGYAAPEQLSGPADHRADIYALGVVLYEMLTGERPAPDIVAPSRKVQLDVRIDEIVLRAMERTPELRYQTAREFRTVLQTVSGEIGSGVTPAASAAPAGTALIPPDAAPVRSPSHRSNQAPGMSLKSKAVLIGCGVLLAASAVLAVLAAALFFFYRPIYKPTARETAQIRADAGPAIQTWLALIDRGAYAESWDVASDGFQRSVARREWATMSAKVRQPLGALISRKPASSERVSSLPGMPSGSYLVAKFDTSFAAMPAAIETVTFVLEKDGHWKASAYLISPASSMKKGPISPEAMAAVVAAKAWLAGIDAGNYPASWKESSGLFQAAITEAGWNAALTNVRKPLGALVSRTLTSAQLTDRLPGAPDGRYVVMQFESSFAEKKSAVETVTFRLEADGNWKAAGYFIK